jgi:excisionase family DNA binding protein
MITKDAYGLKEAGQILGCHPETVRREIRRGRLPAFWLGGSIRILRTALLSYTKTRAVEPDRDGKWARRA